MILPYPCEVCLAIALFKVREIYFLNAVRNYPFPNHSGQKSFPDEGLIRDDSPLPRCQWRKGKVESLIYGNDNVLRGATLTVISKQGKRARASRPIQKLTPFEVTEENKDPDFNYVDVVERCPRRQAAVDGEIRRKFFT